MGFQLSPGVLAQVLILHLQEVKPNQLEQLEHIELPLEKAMEELMDGDILGVPA